MAIKIAGLRFGATLLVFSGLLLNTASADISNVIVYQETNSVIGSAFGDDSNSDLPPQSISFGETFGVAETDAVQTVTSFINSGTQLSLSMTGSASATGDPATTGFLGAADSQSFFTLEFETDGPARLDIDALLTSSGPDPGFDLGPLVELVDLDQFTPMGFAKIVSISGAGALDETGILLPAARYELRGEARGFVEGGSGATSTGSFALNFTVTNVPEPSALSLLATSLGLCAVTRRRRTKV